MLTEEDHIRRRILFRYVERRLCSTIDDHPFNDLTPTNKRLSREEIEDAIAKLTYTPLYGVIV